MVRVAGLKVTCAYLPSLDPFPGPLSSEFYARPLTPVAWGLGRNSVRDVTGKKGLNWRGQNTHLPTHCPRTTRTKSLAGRPV